MDSSMLVLGLIIVAVSGLVAYIGDLVGRKMGRKRLTLFGLRPRHTAIIISIGVGMIIAAATLAATFITSSSIRETFLTIRPKLKQTQQDLLNAKRELWQQERAMDDANRQLADTRINLSDTTGKLHDVNKQLARSLTEQKTIQRNLTDAQKQLKDKQNELNTARKELAVVQNKLKNANAGLQNANGKIQDSEKTLADLLNKRYELTNTVAGLNGQIDGLNKQITAMKLIARSSVGDLAFASGDEIISGLFPTAGSDSDRIKLLNAFFATAGMVIREATNLKNDQQSIFYLDREADDRIVFLQDNEAIKLLSARIAGERSKTPQVILYLMSSINVPVDQGQAFVFVKALPLLPNEKIYDKGDIIAGIELTIDNKVKLADVIEILVDQLLRGKLPEALQDKDKQYVMITRRFDPRNPKDVPQASISQLSWVDLVTVAEKVLSQRGKVKVVARSRATINRFDKLEFELDVAPAGS